MNRKEMLDEAVNLILTDRAFCNAFAKALCSESRLVGRTRLPIFLNHIFLHDYEVFIDTFEYSSELVISGLRNDNEKAKQNSQPAPTQ